MGMFDSLYVKCRECGSAVEFQSKAGDCMLHSYSTLTVPGNVAGDLLGQAETCKCGNRITLRGSVTLFDEQHKQPSALETSDGDPFAYVCGTHGPYTPPLGSCPVCSALNRGASL